MKGALDIHFQEFYEFHQNFLLRCVYFFYDFV